MNLGSYRNSVRVILYNDICGIFRAGKLCRRCLGINDATPGALIDKAMDLMGETLVSEVSHTNIRRFFIHN